MLLAIQIVGTLLFVSVLHRVCASFFRPRSPIDDLPVYGLKPGVFGWFKSRWNILTNLTEITETAYQECNANDQAFRVPWPGRKQIVFLPSGWIDEMSTKKESELSKLSSVQEILDILNYSLVPHLSTHIYHAEVVRTTMVNMTPERFSGVEEEILLALEDEMARLEKTADADGWFGFTGDAGLRVISRTATRAMTGMELCRNEEYNKLTIEFSLGFAKAGFAGMLLPDALRRIVRPLFLQKNRKLANQITELMKPVVEKRMKQHDSNLKVLEEGRNGDIRPLPADTLSALIEEAHRHGPSHYNLENIAARSRLNSFTAIHSTNLATFHSLLILASMKYRCPDGTYSSYIPALRDEIMAAHASIPDTSERLRLGSDSPKVHPATTGWTSAALDSLYGLDSFIREVLRVPFSGPSGLMRVVKAEGGLTLKSGLHLPKGTFVAVPAISIQNHESPDADIGEFNGWRNAQPGSKERREASTTTSRRFLTFGMGKHACPGRFFAVREIKFMLKHILLNYEFKEIEPRKKDPNLFVYQIPPTSREKIMLRRRKVDL